MSVIPAPVTPAAVPTVTADAPITRRAFAKMMLAHGTGNPTFKPFVDSPATEAALIAWMMFENTTCQWNPMGSTFQGSGQDPNCNSAGVKKYANPAQGVGYTMETLGLKGNGYEAIMAAMVAGDGPGIIAAVGRSKWGSHPTMDQYNTALTDPTPGNVILGTGSSSPYQPTDVGAAVPGLGIDLNPLSMFSKLVEYIGKLFAWDTWKRILGVLGGVLLIGLGLSLINRDTFGQVAGDVAKVGAVVA